MTQDTKGVEVRNLWTKQGFMHHPAWYWVTPQAHSRTAVYLACCVTVWCSGVCWPRAVRSMWCCVSNVTKRLCVLRLAKKLVH